MPDIVAAVHRDSRRQAERLLDRQRIARFMIRSCAGGVELPMANFDNVAKAASRLEAALDRIALAVDKPRPLQLDEAVNGELAVRLDGLIHQLRSALLPNPG